MEANEDIEYLKKVLSKVPTSVLIDMRDGMSDLSSNYELKINLINIEISKRKKSIEKTIETATRKLQKEKCKLVLLRANIHYTLNEN